MTTLRAGQTARYRAASGPDVSELRQLLIANRSVRIKATRNGIVVSVSPAAPNARVGLLLDLRARFGWWLSARKRLDYVSEATFKVHGPARARVALLGRDGWTPLALSPIVRVRG